MTATIDSLAKQLDTVANSLDALNKPARNTKGIFNIRKGENPLSSRGYSFHRLIGAMGGHMDKNEAKVEMDIHNRLMKHYEGTPFQKTSNTVMVPLCAAYIPELGNREFVDEIRDLTVAGAVGADPNEMAQMRKSYYPSNRKDLSWIDESLGGSIVAPPAFGELIDLLRKKAALMQAAIMQVAMPPQGRIVFPKQTSATTAYWVGESEEITKSNIGTGKLTLIAKKLAAMCAVPNELYRFASPSVEALVRDDIAKVLALAIDLQLLTGTGTSNKPQGLINYSISTILASTVGTDGNTFEPQDAARMMAAIEDLDGIVNEDACGFIMRPRLFRGIATRRADAITAADGKGPFVTDIIRSLSDGKSWGDVLDGRKVFKTNNMPNNLTKGSGTTLTSVLAGDWSQYILAMSGVMEFESNPWGDTAFKQDQTWIRGISHLDGGPRHEESFAYATTLING